MNKNFSWLLIFLVVGMFQLPAYAQVTTQVVTPVPGAPDAAPGTVTTTVEAPSGTTTTEITTTPGMKSVMTRFKDGTRIEMDSDGSVYQVYSDGARVAAPDGIHTLMDGTSITVKDGKRIP